MMFEERNSFQLEIDFSNIGLFRDYNTEQLIYKSEIVEDIVKNPGKTKILEVMAGLGQIAFDILEKGPDINIIIQEENSICMNDIKERIAHEHLSERCEAVLCQSDNLECYDLEFDLVYSINTLHRIEDPIESIREMFRVLRPGGRIILSDLRRDLIEDFANYRIKELRSVQNSDWMIQNFVRAWSSSYTLEETKGLIKQAGVDNYEVIEDGPVALYAQIEKL